MSEIMVNGKTKAGLVSTLPSTSAIPDYNEKCESASLLPAITSPQISKTTPEFKNVVYVRYYDHVLFNRSLAVLMAPLVREAIGWLVYECEQYITLVLDRDARPPTLKGGDPKATGLVLMRSDLLEFKRLEDCLSQKNDFENGLNSQNASLKSREYAHLAKRSEKLSKKSRKRA